MELDADVIVYQTPENAPLTNWTIESLPLVFSIE